MSADSAPLLTAEIASLLVRKTWPSRAEYPALEALADGRTRCIQPLSEKEHRAAFEAWFFAHKGKTPTRYECYLACARAMGAISEIQP